MTTITLTQLTDALLARSVLCGDITGRGYGLNDKDDHAIGIIAAYVVPRALGRSDISFSIVKDGWIVHSDRLTLEILMAYLCDELLNYISKGSYPAPKPINTTYSTGSHRITPYPI